jgi:hypothetical protein
MCAATDVSATCQGCKEHEAKACTTDGMLTIVAGPLTCSCCLMHAHVLTAALQLLQGTVTSACAALQVMRLGPFLEPRLALWLLPLA